MLKTSRKSLLVVALLLCIGGGSLAAYGFIFVDSNIVNVDMQYAVALSSLVTDSTVTLDAAVTYGPNPARAGLNVDFYYSLNGDPWKYFDSKTTDAGGIARSVFLANQTGAYQFYATVTVP